MIAPVLGVRARIVERNTTSHLGSIAGPRRAQSVEAPSRTSVIKASKDWSFITTPSQAVAGDPGSDRVAKRRHRFEQPGVVVDNENA